MIGRFKPCMEILPVAQQHLWSELSPACRLGLELYGGTAIALRLGHRQSVDFDFFTEKQLDKNELQVAFPFIRRSTVLQDAPNSFTFLVPCGESGDKHVKVSFFGGISFGRVGQPDLTEDGVLQVATLDDLMATKVKVILQRVEAKDYRDIAAMVKAGTSLAHGLAAARKMYGSEFQPSESIKAITCFEGGDLHALSGDERKVLIEASSSVRGLPDVHVQSSGLSVTCDKHDSDVEKDNKRSFGHGMR